MFDQKCLELAVYFLASSTDAKMVNALAQNIQDCIESNVDANGRYLSGEDEDQPNP